MSDTLRKVSNQLREQRMARKLEARRQRAKKQNPIKYIRPEALAELCITTDDPNDSNADWFDETNCLSIDEEWFKYFCHACGYDRKNEDNTPGPCMNCKAEYINYFEKT